MKVPTKSQAVKVGNLGCFSHSNRNFYPMAGILSAPITRNWRIADGFDPENTRFTNFHNRVAKGSIQLT
jgi:hypothetical protein